MLSGETKEPEGCNGYSYDSDDLETGEGYFGNRLVYKIFVAGVPSGTRSAAVKDLFSKYGNIIAVIENKKDQNLPKKRPGLSTYLRGGNCCLVVEDQDTYKRILDGKDYVISNRHIICTPFTSGQKLAKKNRTNNLKRILIKKVPVCVEEQFVREYIITKYGPVETMFYMLPESSSKKKKKNGVDNRNFRTYSIMFQEAEAAERAIEDKVIVLPFKDLAKGTSGEVSCVVEKFDRDMKKIQQQKPGAYIKVKEQEGITMNEAIKEFDKLYYRLQKASFDLVVSNFLIECKLGSDEVLPQKPKNRSRSTHALIQSEEKVLRAPFLKIIYAPRSPMKVALPRSMIIRMAARRRSVRKPANNDQWNDGMAEYCPALAPNKKVYHRLRMANKDYVSRIGLFSQNNRKDSNLRFRVCAQSESELANREGENVHLVYKANEVCDKNNEVCNADNGEQSTYYAGSGEAVQNHH